MEVDYSFHKYGRRHIPPNEEEKIQSEITHWRGKRESLKTRRNHIRELRTRRGRTTAWDRIAVLTDRIRACERERDMLLDLLRHGEGTLPTLADEIRGCSEHLKILEVKLTYIKRGMSIAQFDSVLAKLQNRGGQ